MSLMMNMRFLCFATMLLVPNGMAFARQGEHPSSTTTAPAATDAPPAAAEQDDPTAIFRAPLLREGSYLLEARAFIERDPQLGWWRLVALDNEPNQPFHEFVLLPCTQLSEMQHIVEAAPNRRVEFLVTGKIFAYRGRNYVLPTHAPVVMERERRGNDNEGDRSAAAAAPASRPAASPETAPAEPAVPNPATSESAHESAADIMRGIEEATGSLTRTGAPATHERLPTGRTNQPRAQQLLAEESSLAERRGKITRDGGGGWTFVFDADASGLSDPPVRLLPCLLLERIEEYARRQGSNSPAIVSGQIYLYNSHNYLLPTVFRIPQERRNITP